MTVVVQLEAGEEATRVPDQLHLLPAVQNIHQLTILKGLSHEIDFQKF